MLGGGVSWVSARGVDAGGWEVVTVVLLVKLRHLEESCK